MSSDIKYVPTSIHFIVFVTNIVWPTTLFDLLDADTRSWRAKTHPAKREDIAHVCIFLPGELQPVRARVLQETPKEWPDSGTKER